MFSTTFRYALISLLELAGGEETLQARIIARRHGLSVHYLAVVLRDLRRQGLIDSQKGNRGGYRLLRPAEDINLLHLYRSLAGASSEEETAAGQADADGDSRLGGAQGWLQLLAERWARDLGTTTLAGVCRWDASLADTTKPGDG
ncbi:MAG: Rrf2 family transcriptional regulator [Synechococcaceae cyanobacterium]|nr:Rrf2 family transcriptional regulator [Synechococcaceae cyanobacterium]